MNITGIGRLGRDAELRYVQDGTAVCTLALAFNYGKKQSDGNRLTQWVECALWGKQAESLAQYLKKGNQVSVTAREPHIETFTRHDGTAGNKLVATIIDLEFVGSKKDGDAQDAPQQQQPTPAPAAPADSWDDVPF